MSDIESSSMPVAIKPPVPVTENVPFSSLTTLAVGGPARYLAGCGSTEELSELLDWARSRDLETFVLGGGSNLLVADEGFDGLVIRWTDDAIELDGVRVRAGAGAEWDALVARTVAAGLGGLECLSGIPGRVGAAPMQNVGAYGQEVSETIETVETVDLESAEVRRLAATECGFAYRHSHFKGTWRGRFVITGVDFRLRRRSQGAVSYPDLQRRFEGRRPSLSETRKAVLEIRRSKSMVLDPGDPNRCSAGSFFVNPVVTPEHAEAVKARSPARSRRSMPAFPAGGGVKLSAAWLIEQAGFCRGHHHGPAGLSTRHALALVNRGGATARDLVGLAARIRAAVRDAFGVTLRPEPVFLGFEEDVDELLRGAET